MSKNNIAKNYYNACLYNTWEAEVQQLSKQTKQLCQNRQHLKQAYQIYRASELEGQHNIKTAKDFKLQRLHKKKF